MKTLTNEQRAQKFKTGGVDIGLRSRGHRKLDASQQRELFKNLGSQKPSIRLDQLRILREAIQSSDSPVETQFELQVYETSIRECIWQQQFVTIPHMLAHITSKTTDTLWTRLLTISLSNTKEFHQAYRLSPSEQDTKYVSSIVTRDIPLWRSLVDDESEQIVRALMEQMRNELENYCGTLEHCQKFPLRLNMADLVGSG